MKRGRANHFASPFGNTGGKQPFDGDLIAALVFGSHSARPFSLHLIQNLAHRCHCVCGIDAFIQFRHFRFLDGLILDELLFDHFHLDPRHVFAGENQ